MNGRSVDPVVVETDKLFALVDKLSESVEKTLESLSSAEFDFEGERGGGYVSSLTMAAGS